MEKGTPGRAGGECSASPSAEAAAGGHGSSATATVTVRCSLAWGARHGRAFPRSRQALGRGFTQKLLVEKLSGLDVTEGDGAARRVLSSVGDALHQGVLYHLRRERKGRVRAGRTCAHLCAPVARSNPCPLTSLMLMECLTGSNDQVKTLTTASQNSAAFSHLLEEASLREEGKSELGRTQQSRGSGTGRQCR